MLPWSKGVILLSEESDYDGHASNCSVVKDHEHYVKTFNAVVSVEFLTDFCISSSLVSIHYELSPYLGNYVI